MSVMIHRMVSMSRDPSLSMSRSAHTHCKRPKILLTAPKFLHVGSFSSNFIRYAPVFFEKLSRWEPSTFTYAPTEKSGENLLEKPVDLFDISNSNKEQEQGINHEDPAVVKRNHDQLKLEFQFLKWPMWLLGPAVLLVTGVVPTLWLPVSSIFLGPSMISLLAFVGLDCIFNLGAALFLLMADSCARSKNREQACRSNPPFSYKFWNIVASLVGLMIPAMLMFGSESGILQPSVPFILSAVLLAPYLLLLSVQLLTEALTWHWESPVWLVTPIVYEAYRLLQLMRGLKLGAELSAPAWMMHTIKGLVCWWVMILGVQLLRIAWFAGFMTQARSSRPTAFADAL